MRNTATLYMLGTDTKYQDRYNRDFYDYAETLSAHSEVTQSIKAVVDGPDTLGKNVNLNYPGPIGSFNLGCL